MVWICRGLGKWSIDYICETSKFNKSQPRIEAEVNVLGSGLVSEIDSTKRHYIGKKILKILLKKLSFWVCLKIEMNSGIFRDRFCFVSAGSKTSHGDNLTNPRAWYKSWRCVMEYSGHHFWTWCYSRQTTQKSHSTQWRVQLLYGRINW